MLLKEFVEDIYFPLHVDINNKKSTAIAKRQILNRNVLPVLGNRELEKIGKPDFIVFVAACSKSGLSNKTINNHLTVIRNILTVAADMDLIPAVPTVKRMRVVQEDRRALNAQELERLIKHAPEPWGLYMRFVALTGLRIGELRALEWDHITLGSDPVIRVVQTCVGKWSYVGTPKGYKARTVSLNKSAVKIIKDIKRLSKFFLALPGLPEKPLNYRRCERAIIKARTEAHFDWLVGWHTLRHTFASNLAQQGVSLQQIKDLLGHVDISTTLKYAHLSPSSLADAVAKLDE